MSKAMKPVVKSKAKVQRFIRKYVQDSESSIIEDETTEEEFITEEEKERKESNDVFLTKVKETIKENGFCNNLDNYDFSTLKFEDVQPVEDQIEVGTAELRLLIENSNEMVTNVRVACVKYELARRATVQAEENERMKMLEEESKKAAKMFRAINEDWKSIKKQKDPLDIHTMTEEQRGKCQALIDQKDALIEELKRDLKKADECFLSDLAKQEEDINLLIDRINQQVALIRKSYRIQLEYLQELIDSERDTLLHLQEQQWKCLIKTREKLELHNIHERYSAIDAHTAYMDKLTIDQYERVRSSQLELQNSINTMHVELDKLKSLCMLNHVKLNYNFQVLRKRDEENQLVKAQQRRTITQLQDKVIKLRRARDEIQAKKDIKIKHLTSELFALHKYVTDSFQKADKIAQTNSAKYMQLWDFNESEARKLIKEIIDVDRVIYEQLLQIPWVPVDNFSDKKENIPSYKEGIGKIQRNKPILPVKRSQLYQDKQFTNVTPKDMLIHKKLLSSILQKLADEAGFLVDGNLKLLLNSYTKSQETLVFLSNIFDALGIHEQHEIQLLSAYFYPYTYCQTCQQSDRAEILLNDSDMEINIRVSSEESQPYVLDQIQMVLSERLTVVSTSIHDRYVEEGIPVRTLHASEAQKASSDVKKFHVKSFMSSYGSYLPSGFGFGSLTASEKTSGSSSPWYKKRSRPVKKKQKNAQVTLPCRNVRHKLIIDPIYVIRALRQFMSDFYAQYGNVKDCSLEALSNKERYTISRQMLDQEVISYWGKMSQFFSKNREEVWDALIDGLKGYYESLKLRNKYNEEIKRLVKNNSDLRQLLQQYTQPCTDTKFENILVRMKDFMPEVKTIME